MKSRRLLISLLVLGLLCPLAFVSANTILSAYKYAWSDHAGYLNFANVIVSDTTLSGYAWSKNSGWIKFNPSEGGVLNHEGNLSGYAWGESLGWINFDGVSIDTNTGRFSGTATGTLVGTLSFDCPNYCDVRTDWRLPCNAWTYSAWGNCSGGQQLRDIISSSPSGCSGGSPIISQSCAVNNSSAIIPSVLSSIEAINQDLILSPKQSGRYLKDTEPGKIILEVPPQEMFGNIIYIISEELLGNSNLVPAGTELINGVFYNIIAKDAAGNLVHNFSPPLTITLPMPYLLDNHNLAIYWLNEINQEWVLLPEAIFSNDHVTFQVDHLTKFAIFEIDDEQAEIATSTKPTIKKPVIRPSIPVIINEVNTSTSVIEHQTIIEKIKDLLIPEFLKPKVEVSTTTIMADDDLKTRTLWLFLWLLLAMFIIALAQKKKFK